MSLPITAVGPLKVETKPILTVSPAKAGCASAKTAAPANQNAFFIITPLLVIEPDPPCDGQRLFRAPLYQVRYFVREIAGQRQA
jgi:hypothetical protein